MGYSKEQILERLNQIGRPMANSGHDIDLNYISEIGVPGYTKTTSHRFRQWLRTW
jgi:hypothetical protein